MTCESCGHVSPAPDGKVICLHDCVGRQEALLWRVAFLIYVFRRRIEFREFEARSSA